jgi:hypothetical protein
MMKKKEGSGCSTVDYGAARDEEGRVMKKAVAQGEDGNFTSIRQAQNGKNNDG